ncbi:MAG: hypothetical protein KAU44_00440, partial [Candidatus Marinimicrobia bacterium]|nr:hypothetical protein [Candidatus Neomarinimicrobiota bacterium]
IKDAKIFVVGTKERITRLPEVEEYLINKTKTDLDNKAIEDLVDVSFIGKRITDPDYLSYKAKVETARAIFRALGSD